MTIIKGKIFGTNLRPRACVFRSNLALQIQLIDDNSGKTILAGSTREISEGKTAVQKATYLGEMIAKKAKEKKISQIVFDRNNYQYQGRVKAVAEAMRGAGIKF